MKHPATGAMLRLEAPPPEDFRLFAAPDRREAMGSAGRGVIESNRGALPRLLELIEARLG